MEAIRKKRSQEKKRKLEKKKAIVSARKRGRGSMKKEKSRNLS